MPSPRSPFDAFVHALVRHLAVCAALALALPTRRYIRGQVYSYTARAEAGMYYKQAAKLQAAWNAVYAGVAGLCTMYLGGLIMGAFARSAGVGAQAARGAASAAATTTGEVTAVGTAGAAATETAAAVGSTAGRGLLARTTARIVAALGRVAPWSPEVVETTILELTLGVPVRGALSLTGAAVTDEVIGRARFGKLVSAPVAGAMGGVARVGPVAPLVMNHMAGTVEDNLRRRWAEEISRPEAEAVVADALECAGRVLDARVKACGRFAPLLLVPPSTLDSTIRLAAENRARGVTHRIVKANSGLFWGPDRQEVRTEVDARFGAEIWAPIARDTDAAFNALHQEFLHTRIAMDRAFRQWAYAPPSGN